MGCIAGIQDRKREYRKRRYCISQTRVSENSSSISPGGSTARIQMEIICSESGFLGLDNIGVFNRSSVIPGAMQLEQADGTNWMGMYALNMMDIAMEIAMKDEAFEDTAPFLRTFRIDS